LGKEVGHGIFLFGKAEEGEKFLGAAIGLPAGDSLEPRKEAQVLQNGKASIHVARALEHCGHIAPHLGTVGGNTENLNFFGGSADQSAEDFDGCGLSRAVWAKKPDDFPFFHLE